MYRFTYKDQIYRIEKLYDACLKHFEIELCCELHLYDLLIMAFQNIWHLKDWVKNDPVLSENVKSQIVEKFHKSNCLKIAQEICNGSKHLNRKYSSKLTTVIHFPKDSSEDIDYTAARKLVKLMIDELRSIFGQDLWPNMKLDKDHS